MAENNSPPPLMTDKELLMETGAFNEIMNAAFEYADAYCASGDEPRRYSAAIDHLRKTVRAEITKFSRANYKTNAATEFDAQAVAAQAPAAVAVPDERTAFEAVASDNGKWPKAIEHDSKGNYFLMGTASGWTWWQARAALAATPAAKPAVCDSVHIDDFGKVATPAAKAEPVAYRYQVRDTEGKHVGWLLQELCTGRDGEPLYTAPQATQPGADAPMVNMTPPATSRDRWMYEQGRLAEREIICAAIKTEDDYCVAEGDYMLDSDDCINVARGSWVRPDFEPDAAMAAKEL